MVFEPEQEAFFELATERLPDRGNRTRLEAGNPSGNGATRNFEQIDAFYCRCDHQSLRLPKAVYEAYPSVNTSLNKEQY
jgi:hypothetical protein